MPNKRSKAYNLKKGVDFIGVTCVFYCHDGQGNLLLHKRSQKCRDEKGVWDCGGGSMEFGEVSFESAARREILEEYGARPKKVEFWGPVNVLRKQGRKQTHWIAFLFTAVLDPKQVKLGEPEAMEELGWFPLKKLPKPRHSMLDKHLRAVLRAGAEF